MESTVRSELSRLGVARGDEAEAAERVKRTLKNALRSKKGRWILGDHAEAQTAWPVSGRIGNKLVTGTIDRIFRDEDGRFWIIDFKVSEHRGSDLHAFLASEERRYRTQMNDYATLVSRLTNGPIYLGLYFPLLNAWREWEFVMETADAAH